VRKEKRGCGCVWSYQFHHRLRGRRLLQSLVTPKSRKERSSHSFSQRAERIETRISPTTRTVHWINHFTSKLSITLFTIPFCPPSHPPLRSFECRIASSKLKIIFSDKSTTTAITLVSRSIIAMRS